MFRRVCAEVFQAGSVRLGPSAGMKVILMCGTSGEKGRLTSMEITKEWSLQVRTSFLPNTISVTTISIRLELLSALFLKTNPL